MKTRKLTRSGVELSELGFGAAGVGNLFKAVGYQECEDAILAAHKLGINYFDTAPHYGAGLSERRMGVAIHSLLNSPHVISTKVGRMLRPMESDEKPEDHGFVNEAPFARVYGYSYDAVMRSFEDSVQRLGVDQIDILYMHDIGEYAHGDNHEQIFNTAMDSGYKALDELRSQGTVKAIGLGVNEWQVCDRSLEHADFDCFMTANCFTLLNNSILDSFVGKCESRNIDLVVAAPFNSGVLASGSKNPNAYFYQEAPKEIVDKVVQLEAVCDEFSVNLGAAAIQYPLRCDQVKSVVIGMTSASRIESNLNWYSENIDDEFWTALMEKGLINPIGQ